MPWSSRTMLFLLWTCSVPFCSYLLLFRGCPLSLLLLIVPLVWGSPDGSVVSNLPANAGDAGDAGSIPGSERSLGGRIGNPLQYSCLKNPMDRGVWRATVHGVAKSQTQLSELATHTYIALLGREDVIRAWFCLVIVAFTVIYLWFEKNFIQIPAWRKVFIVNLKLSRF